MNNKLLTRAVQQGIINNEQAVSLLELFEAEQTKSGLAENSGPAESSGEQLKFIRSFGDVFIALGVLLLALTSNQLAVSTGYQITTIVFFFVIAEWLVGHKRLVLPGITILLSILYFVNEVADTSSVVNSIPIAGESLDVVFMVITSLLFYARYKMPFSLYPVAVGGIYLCIELSGINVMEHPYIFVVLGLIVFAVAMWYDSRDIRRVTNLSDNGFWLHLLAAPLIVHGMMVSLFFSKYSDGLQSSSFYLLLLFILFFFIALFVDRRAIMVSSFAYALYAVVKFSYQQFAQVDNLIWFIFMGVGLFIIFFGTYWYKIRKLIFSPLSSLKICRFVPDFDIK